ncbi:HlyD family efflux transporter periplasmic adaptor subunit [Alteromonas sp. a30]|uniref:HlyD family efflux transporter periplasmic adaptor subunit n=1 Tax=Alteromonas sp. a30 TaxID=2730917 RepID=UPI00228066B1|nr:HlyD family efflux transporter periplasmic adaptor subunit [Alteromonas sp. a30]MCY7294568.1 HlyD family efflux transporter periplasmic adaptor subunit [Alteromonas sp. a30]
MLRHLKVVVMSLTLLIISTYSMATEALFLIGNVDYSRQHLIYSSFEGVVSDIHVRSGITLTKGQPLFDVTPFNPNISRKQIINDIDSIEVSEVLVREGEKIEQYEAVVRLNHKSDMQIRALSYPPTSQKLNIGQEVSVIFDPDGEPYQTSGIISSLHSHPIQHGKIPTVEAEISINNNACFADPICSTHYKIGNFVKLQFTSL